MTIKVEQEALLKLLSAPPLVPPSVTQTRCLDEFECACTEKEPIGHHDDDSVFTVSTASLSCDAEDGDYDKRVSFTETLVTEEWTREYTPKHEVPKLFYSSEEMQR